MAYQDIRVGISRWAEFYSTFTDIIVLAKVKQGSVWLKKYYAGGGGGGGGVLIHITQNMISPGYIKNWHYHHIILTIWSAEVSTLDPLISQIILS